jgi:hypothetical protein
MTIKRVYLSSTFKDLLPFRAAVARALRRINKEVEGMEDYVTSDERPLDKCRNGVAAADVYVGLFAHRYGFIPTGDNPGQKSITELEYRHARESKKPCLLFLLDEEASWPPKFMDFRTSEGDHGQRMEGLRQELEKEDRSYFRGEEELAALVTAAVTNLEAKTSTPSTPPAKAAPERRQITRDLFVAYSYEDDLRVRALFDELLPEPRAFSSLLAQRALFARTEDDFLILDRDIQTCDIAVAVLSRITVSKMETEPDYTAEVLDVLRSRTGSLVAFTLDSESIIPAQAWKFDHIIDASDHPAAGAPLIESIKQTLAACKSASTVPVIGVPLVVAAMTEAEAADLCDHPEIISDELGRKAQEKFEKIRDALGDKLAARYGPTREQWRSPGSQRTVSELSLEAIRRLAGAKNSRLQGRAIKLQRYSFEALMSGRAELRGMYREMSDQGCVLVIDELSMFHPKVRQALAGSPMVISPNTAVLTVSPFPPSADQPHEILREWLRAQLQGVFDRYASDYDPQCELNVSDECHVRRWLHQSLPETLKVLRTARAIPEQLAIFAKELDAENDPTLAAHLYSRGGGL